MIDLRPARYSNSNVSSSRNITDADSLKMHSHPLFVFFDIPSHGCNYINIKPASHNVVFYFYFYLIAI